MIYNVALFFQQEMAKSGAYGDNQNEATDGKSSEDDDGQDKDIEVTSNLNCIVLFSC